MTEIEQRFERIEARLKERGIVDVKFTYGNDPSDLNKLRHEVADMIEAVLDGKGVTNITPKPHVQDGGLIDALADLRGLGHVVGKNYSRDYAAGRLAGINEALSLTRGMQDNG